MPIIQITTTIGCSNNCIFCPQDIFVKNYYKRNPKAPRLMSLDRFKKILEKIPKNNTINFCGMSEPFQNPNCHQLVLHAHRSGFKNILLFTTLMGLTLDKAKAVFETIPFYRYSRYLLSLHLPSKEKIENIIVSKEYLQVLKYVVGKTKRLELHYHGRELNHQVRQVLDAGNVKVGHAPPHDRAGLLSGRKFVSSKRKRGHIKCVCWERVILPDGTVLLCNSDYSMKYVLGNLLTTNYSSIMSSEVLKFIKQAFKNDSIETSCRYCHDSRSSGNNCIAYLYNDSFTFNKIPQALKLFFYQRTPKGYLYVRNVKRKLLSQPTIHNPVIRWFEK
ncbi:radical SAM protein [Pseudomonadota bacterium]